METLVFVLSITTANDKRTQFPILVGNCLGHLQRNIFQIIVSYFDLAGAAPVVPKLTLPLVESIRGNINRTEVIVQMWGQQQADQSPLMNWDQGKASQIWKVEEVTLFHSFIQFSRNMFLLLAEEYSHIPSFDRAQGSDDLYSWM